MDTPQGAVFDAQVLARVLGAIADLNAQLLEALVETAKSRPELFPLPQSLRSHFSRFPLVQCRQGGRCGIVLADAGFTDCARWIRVASGADLGALPQEHKHWLSAGLGVVLTHSVLMVAWHTVHAVPSLVSVLLGMNHEVACEFGKLSISDLAFLARRRSSWIRPRWADRPDVWAGIIACGNAASDQEPPTVLRCLKVTATESRRMLNSTTVEASLEL